MSAVSLLTFTGTDNLLLTGADGNLELKLWDTSSGYNSNVYTPRALHTLQLRCPSPGDADGRRHLSAIYEPSHGVLLLSHCASPADDAAELLAVSLARRGADSAFGSLTVFSASTPLLSLAADPHSDALQVFCVTPTAVQCHTIDAGAQLAGGAQLSASGGADATGSASGAVAPAPPAADTSATAGEEDRAQAQQLEAQLQNLQRLVSGGALLSGQPPAAAPPPMPSQPPLPQLFGRGEGGGP